MISIHELKSKYPHKIDSLDLDLLICHAIKKEREFILTHPEYKLSKKQILQIENYAQRRLKNEPLAYILEKREFYTLDFKVNKYTLIPRPETELMVEMALEYIKANKYGNIKALKQKNDNVINEQSSPINIIDIGTGSGNIIISIFKNLNIDSKFKIQNSKFFATDISKEALRIAKQNAKNHNVNKNIAFFQGNLLSPLIQNSKFKIQNSRTLILANLPYLSEEIYNTCGDNVKKYEPKTALYSDNCGLAHYDQLLSQIKLLTMRYEPCPEAKFFGITCLMEISPEQKRLLKSIIKIHFPKANIEFKKDLAQKWRICKIEI